MKTYRAAALVLALAGLAALPACSDYGNHHQAAAVAPMPPALSPQMVMQVQTELQQQGFYKGSIDGLWGPETQDSLRGYQQAHGLVANGQLNDNTLASLNAPPPAPPVAEAPAAAAPVAAAAPAPATTQ